LHVNVAAFIFGPFQEGLSMQYRVGAASAKYRVRVDSTHYNVVSPKKDIIY